MKKNIPMDDKLKFDKDDDDTLNQIVDLIINKFRFAYYAGQYRRALENAELATTSAYAKANFVAESVVDFENNINHIFKTLKNLDPEVISGVLSTLFQNFDNIVQKEQKEFCERTYHDFTNWKKGSKNIPIFDADDNITGFIEVKGLEYRRCKNCGLIQIPETLEEKKAMTLENARARKRTKYQGR